MLLGLATGFVQVTIVINVIYKVQYANSSMHAPYRPLLALQFMSPEMIAKYGYQHLCVFVCDSVVRLLI